MKSAWRLTGKPAAPALKFVLEHVLVWYDEPQVITARDQYDTRYLGVAVDDSEDREIVRWIYAPVTDLEFHALVRGGLSIREALATEDVIVADRRVDGGAFEDMWRVGDADIPDEIRPTEESFLPEDTRARLFSESTVPEPEIRIAGKAVHDSIISFVDLGSIVELIQNLWHALAGFVYYDGHTPAEKVAGEGFLPSTLLVAGTGTGSFSIKVKPTAEVVFNRVSVEYRKLLSIANSETELKNALDRYGRDVTNSFAEYMTLVEFRKMEVFTQSVTTTAFVGPRKAARVVSYPYIGQRKVRKRKVVPDEVYEKTVQLNGHFGGYSYFSKKFDFVSSIDGETYSGDIEDSVLTRTPLDRGLVLSSSATYVAEIRPVRRGDRTTYTLLGFWKPNAAQ